MASTNLSRTLSSGSASNKFTFSAWVKRSVDTAGRLLTATGSSGDTYFRFNGDATIEWSGDASNASSAGYFVTNRQFDDYSGWYHLVIRFDSTQGSASNRVRFYVNGVQEESFSSYTDVNQNAVDKINLSGNTLYIGGTVSSQYFHGLMSHVNYSDGYSYAPTEFGETDSTTGEWKIKVSPSISYGTNGFFILKDGATLTDSSPNSNNFAVANGTLTATEDCPSHVFATLNPLVLRKGTLTNGNLTHEGSGATAPNNVISSLGVTSGKFYVEAKIITGNNYNAFGVVTEKNPYVNGGTDYLSNSNDALIYAYSDIYRGGGTISGTYATLAVNDIVQIAIDADNKFLYFGVNGTWQNSGNPASGASGTGALNMTTYLGSDVTYFVAGETGGAGNTRKIEFNFGNGYFGTTAISSEGTNASGIGKFEYDVPAGYTALSTKGLNE